MKKLIITLAIILYAFSAFALSPLEAKKKCMAAKGKAAGGAMTTETVRPGSDDCWNSDLGAVTCYTYGPADDSDYGFYGSTPNQCWAGEVGYACWDLIDEADLDTGDYIRIYDTGGTDLGVGAVVMTAATGSGTISSIVVHNVCANTSGSDGLLITISGNAGTAWESEETITCAAQADQTATFSGLSWTDSNVKSGNLLVRFRGTDSSIWDYAYIYQVWAVINP